MRDNTSTAQQSPTAQSPSHRLIFARRLLSIVVWLTFIGEGFFVSALTGGPFHVNDWGLSGWIFFAVAFIPTRVVWRRLAAGAVTAGHAVLSAAIVIGLLTAFASLFAWVVSVVAGGR